MPEYKIQGTGLQTNRKRTKIYYAKNEDEAKQKAENDGTIVEEIILIPEPPEPPPTERQLAYAQSLGIYIPPNATIKFL